MNQDTQAEIVPSFDDNAAKFQFFQEIQDRAKGLPLSAVEKHSPHVAARALWMLAQGAKVSVIRKTTGLSYSQIKLLEWRHDDTLEVKRKEFAQKYAVAAMAFTDILMEKAEQLMDDPEQLRDIQPDRIAAVVNIMTDKSAQLSGMATSKVEHVKGVSMDDAQKAIEDAKKRVAERLRQGAIDAEVVK